MGAEIQNVPPYSEQAEKAVLGCMLRENETVDEVREVISAAHFYTGWHQLIFGAIVEIVDAGRGADLVSLAGWLESHGKVKEHATAYAAIGELWDAAPTAQNAREYAEIVKRLGIQRLLIRIATETLTEAYRPTENPRAVAVEAERRLTELAAEESASCILTMGQCTGLATDWIERRKNGTDQDGVATGFMDLDTKTGGLHDGELIIIAARPSVGKTAIAVNIIRNITGRGLPVYFASLEQSGTELGMRWLTLEGRVDGDNLRRGTTSKEDMGKIIEARDRLDSCRLFLDHTPGQRVQRIISQARRLKRKEGIRAVFIDYLGLIAKEGHRNKSRAEEVGETTHALKNLARELRVPVVCLCQLNRQGGDGETEPSLSDLRESGDIEQDADTVLMLWRPEGRDSNLIRVEVKKQRNGSIGPVTLTFLKWFGRFENHAPDYRS